MGHIAWCPGSCNSLSREEGEKDLPRYLSSGWWCFRESLWWSSKSNCVLAAKVESQGRSLQPSSWSSPGNRAPRSNEDTPVSFSGKEKGAGGRLAEEVVLEVGDMVLSVVLL